MTYTFSQKVQIIGNAEKNFVLAVDRNIRANLRNEKVYINEAFGRKDVLCTEPLSPSSPGTIDFGKITKACTGSLILWVHGYPGHGGQRIVVKLDDIKFRLMMDSGVVVRSGL